MKKIRHLFIILCAVLSLSMFILPVKAEEAAPSPVDSSTLLSDYAYAFDLDNGQVLINKNGDERIYPASLTKMMTCITAVEHLSDLNQTVTITDEMLDGLYEAGASVAGLAVNDEPTIEDLLYCSALPSGADASNALAYTAAGSISGFVDMMNEKAAEIGMHNTHFANVTGLHDPDHYSTAHDLCLLLQYCVKNETFARVFSTHEYTTSPLASAPDGLHVYSTTMMTAYNGGFDLSGLIGSKTGYTPEAERCFAYWADVNDIHFVAVTAHAVQSEEHMYPHVEDAETVLESLRSWKKDTAALQGDTVSSITVHHMFKHRQTVNITAPEDIVLDMPSEDQAVISVNCDQDIDSSYEEQTIPAVINVSINDVPVYETSTEVTVPADPNILARFIKRIRSLF